MGKNKNLNLYATGVDALGRKVELYTTPRKKRSYLTVEGALFYETTNFNVIIEVFNGLCLRERNEDNALL